MNQTKQLLIKIWKEEIPVRFAKGLITYERQLQSELYNKLKQLLADDYEVWVEPVIYLAEYDLNKVKPDVFITKGDEIVAIIELKFKPWEYPEFHPDIDKLLRFDKISNGNVSLPFGFIPTSHNWKVQKGGKSLSYRLTNDHLNVFIVFGKPDSDAFTSSNFKKKPNNFLLLYGHIKESSEVIFNIAS